MITGKTTLEEVFKYHLVTLTDGIDRYHVYTEDGYFGAYSKKYVNKVLRELYGTGSVKKYFKG